MRAEASPSIARAFALTTGTIGLFAIAVLVLAVTPGNQAQPVAVSATTAPEAGVSTDGMLGGPTIASARGVPTVSLIQATPARALATPIGEGRYALVSQAAIGNAVTAELDVTLPSGRVTVGAVVERSGDTILIALPDAEPGHEVAEQRPHDREVVTVMAQPPVTIAYADVPTLEVAEGTAIVDSDGNLVGLCTKSGAGRRVRVIAVDYDMATPDTDSTDTTNGTDSRAGATDDGVPDTAHPGATNAESNPPPDATPAAQPPSSEDDLPGDSPIDDAPDDTANDPSSDTSTADTSTADTSDAASSSAVPTTDDD